MPEPRPGSGIPHYHNHCYFCDGEGTPEDYLKYAEEVFPVPALGFSCHAPLPFAEDWVMKEEQLPVYLQTLKELRERSSVEIYIGLEVDYLKGVTGPSRFSALLDYTVGSVHGLMKEGVFRALDSSPEDLRFLRDRFFGGEFKKVSAAYFGALRDMLSGDKPDILGHLDLLKKFNRDQEFFRGDEPWYREEVIQTLEAAAAAEVVVEVNTGGMARKRTLTPYPEFWILQECFRRHIPVQINSDSHHPRHSGFAFPEAAALLKEAGYREIRVLREKQWRDIPLL